MRSEVAELRTAVNAAAEQESACNGSTGEEEEEDEEEGHAHSGQLPLDPARARENGPIIREINSVVNTGLLVDIDTTVTESHKQPLLTGCLLVPESTYSRGGESGGGTGDGGEGGGAGDEGGEYLDKSANIQDSNHQCLSQELF